MKKLLVTLTTLLAALTLSLAQAPDQVPGQLLVQLHPGYTPQALVESLNASWQGRIFAHARTISPDLYLHLITFDTLQLTSEVARVACVRHVEVQEAQANHYLSLRGTQAVPNDPGFGSQWGLNNTGQSGGVLGADVSAVEAWNRTVGGTSVLGDTLVVAVIDDGFDLDHEDLNFWVNQAEIPNNGLDDDQNGYIDDVRGWNAYNSTPLLPEALHGTHVAGVLGAKGDNGLGGTGINWNVKIMPIAGSSGTEDVVLEAYGYALAQRKRYEQTQGQQGAYVVVTNSSFGVDNADPAQFPLWCAMYDTLGAHGILSVAAAMNIGNDVEVSGDIPTRCTSPYLIAVTNTTPVDTRNPSAAFGAVSIDLGAPGSGIYSTLPSDGYGFQTGTSFAAPFVSGTLALMYADACADFMLNYQQNPAQVALTVKELLLAGVDTLGTLSGAALTSGRLNASKALQQLADSCALLPSNCLPPYNLQVSQIRDTSVQLSWTALDSSLGFQVRYRPLGDTTWADSLSEIQPPFTLGGLLSCTDYEWQVGTICPDSSVAYYLARSFRSEGCCEPPTGLSLLGATDSSLLLRWDSVFGATDYGLRYRVLGDTTWTLLNLGDTLSTELSALLPCTAYEIQLSALCDTLDRGFGSSEVLRTEGCGACLDQVYCSTQGLNVAFEWVAGVQIGGVSRQSGADNGYIANTSPVIILPIDSLLPVRLEPGYNGPAFDETWRVWIDLNQDGTFDDTTELLYDSGPVQGVSEGDILIPSTALSGNTRMRVSMRFAGFTGGDRPISCGTFGEGETEDYCVFLQPADTNICPAPSFVLADFLPGTDSLRIRWIPEPSSDSFLVSLNSLDGLPLITVVTDTPELLLGGLPTCARYELRIQPYCEELLGLPTEPQTIRTKGCGPCQDLAYCPSQGASDSLWIERVELGTLALSTGANGGYGDFTDFSLAMKVDTLYAITLVPGATGATRPVFWDVWIDWDGDGVFSIFDRVGQANATTEDTIRGAIGVSPNFQPGGTRMRVSLRQGVAAGVCELFVGGEVEDYCIDLINPVNVRSPQATPDLLLYPNPARDQLTLETDAPMTGYRIGDVLGRTWMQASAQRDFRIALSVKALPPGVYWVEVETLAGPTRAWMQVR